MTSDTLMPSAIGQQEYYSSRTKTGEVGEHQLSRHIERRLLTARISATERIENEADLLFEALWRQYCDANDRDNIAANRGHHANS
jgi:hypothetical protein